MKGFILTRQWRDTPTGIQLEIWLASEQGPLRLIVPNQTAVCFFCAADFPLLQSLLSKIPSIEYKKVGLKNFHGDAVMALYCQQQQHLRQVSQVCRKQCITLWEEDIKPPERFLMERFITAALELQVPKENKSKQAFSSLYSQKVKPTDYQPTLKVASLDIETSVDDSFVDVQLYSIAVYSESSSVVFMVDTELEAMVIEENGDGLMLHRCESEQQCLHHFLRWFEKEDPDIIIGWHVVQFDLWVLENLCRKFNIPFSIGRARQTLYWRHDSDATSGKIDRHYVQIPGRVVLDGIELLRTAFYHFDSFSLQSVANALLGENKLLVGDRGQQITDLYHTDKWALAAYNLQDCKLVWDIFKKTKLLDFAIARAKLTGLPMDRMGGSVASFDYAYLPRLHRKGYVAPNLGELESDVMSPGGYVMRSKPGLYRDVLVLDFKSLYPSIIRTFFIDPHAFWLAEHQKMPDSKTVPGFNGARFSREGAILPDLIAELWAARDQAKADNDQPLSQAIKIIMNSFYGVLGSNGCRFFDPRVCSSITLRGHEIIQRSRDWITDQGYDVIYGDTDSVFVWLGEGSVESSPEEIGHQLAVKLNAWWGENLKRELGLESNLEIEFETHYTHFLMPTIRGSNKGSKKRYAGMVERFLENGTKKEELVFKGLETVRNDWTPLAKEFQQMLYHKVFKQEPYHHRICEVVDQLLAGEVDEQLIYTKKLRRSLQAYQKSNPPHVKAARRLFSLTGKLLGRGDVIRYVITVNGPEPVDCLQSKIDYQHYIDKQLKPIADSILNFIDDKFDKIIDQQLKLI